MFKSDADINECIEDVCAEKTTCENVDGSYQCVVKPGYQETDPEIYEGLL